MYRAVTRLLWLVALGHLTLELCNNYLPVLYPVVRAQMGLSFTQFAVILGWSLPLR